jgi:hypothetical protein
LKLKISSLRDLTNERSTVIIMSLNSDDKNHDNKDEDRSVRSYGRDDKPPIRRPMAITALGIASIAALVMMLSFGAYFVAYAPSIHAEWHTSPSQSSYWWSANPADLIPSSPAPLVHVTEANIAAFGGITMILAALPAIVSFGLLRGRSWSWNASIIFFAVASASLLLTVSSRGEGSIQVQGQGISANSIVQSLLYAGLSIAVLYYLTRARIKTFFGKNATSDDSRNSMQHQSPTIPSS